MRISEGGLCLCSMFNFNVYFSTFLAQTSLEFMILIKDFNLISIYFYQSTRVAVFLPKKMASFLNVTAVNSNLSVFASSTIDISIPTWAISLH